MTTMITAAFPVEIMGVIIHIQIGMDGEHLVLMGIGMRRHDHIDQQYAHDKKFYNKIPHGPTMQQPSGLFKL